MKKILLPAMLAALASFSAGAMAQSFYVGAHAGTTTIKLDCAGTDSCDDSGTGYRLTGGYRFASGLAIEAGFASFGKAKARDGSLQAEAKAAGPFLGVGYALPLNDSFGFNLRAGLINIKTEVSGTVQGVGSAKVSDTKSKAYAGVGLTYSLAPSTQLELAFDSTRAELDGDDATVRAFMVGIRQSF